MASHDLAVISSLNLRQPFGCAKLDGSIALLTCLKPVRSIPAAMGVLTRAVVVLIAVAVLRITASQRAIVYYRS